jgi:hypothetical protein
MPRSVDLAASSVSMAQGISRDSQGVIDATEGETGDGNVEMQSNTSLVYGGSMAKSFWCVGECLLGMVVSSIELLRGCFEGDGWMVK